jgi:hypothetical protein
MTLALDAIVITECTKGAQDSSTLADTAAPVNLYEDVNPRSQDTPRTPAHSPDADRESQTP